MSQRNSRPRSTEPALRAAGRVDFQPVPPPHAAAYLSAMSARELTGARTEQVAMPLPGLPQPGARPAAAPGPRGTTLPSELFLG